MLLSALSGYAATPAIASGCPTEFTLVSGTTDVCERTFTTASNTVASDTEWEVPHGVTSIDVLVVGGGAGGRNGTASSNLGGSGGGGGGIALLTSLSVTLAERYRIIVGNGGASNANGRDSEFLRGDSSLAKGIAASGVNGGNGVVVSGGFTYQGKSGGNGSAANPSNATAPGELVTGGLFATNAQRWGGGGAGGNRDTNGANGGDQNSGSGGGGAGGTTTNVARSGTPGLRGVVVIRTTTVAPTVPGTPTISSITVGDQQLSVAFTVSDGGSVLTAMEYSIDGGANWLPASGTTSPLTITGLTNGTSYGVQVRATNAQGTGPPSATTTATPLGAALTPLFDSVTRTSEGFTVHVTNFDPAYTFTPTVSVGSVTAGTPSGSTLPLTVTGLSAGAPSTVTVSTSRATYSNGSANVTGTALDAALTPIFGLVTRTANGFTVSITNYDAAYTWTATSGTVNSSGLLSVTGLAASATQTVTVSTSRSGYVDGSADITGQALDAQTITWAPTNTALTMPGATFRPSSGAAAAGSITYSINDPGTTGCTLTSSTTPATWPIDINYARAGTCTVRASASATGTFASAFTDVNFVITLAPQSITASSTPTRLQPGQTATVSDSGSSGSGAITWTNTTPARCTLTGTTVTAVTDGSCILTVTIAADLTYAAASDSTTITVFTPGGGGGGGSGGGGGGSGGDSGSGGSSAGGSSSGSTGGNTGSGSNNGSGSSTSGAVVQSQDNISVPGSGSTTRGRALPPPPEDVEVRPLRVGSRSSVLVKQPPGAVGSQVLATVVIVRNAQGNIISRINVTLKNGQGEVQVTVPYVAEGYTVDVYNVNQVGVSTGALTRSPLVRATTITKRGEDRRPTLFGTMLGKPIIFNGNSAALSAQAKRQLNTIARNANTRGERIFITGFARKGGGTPDELASLSTRRALAAAEYLSKRGVRVWIRYWGAGSLNGTGAVSDRRVEVRTSAAPIPRTLVP